MLVFFSSKLHLKFYYMYWLSNARNFHGLSFVHSLFVAVLQLCIQFLTPFKLNMASSYSVLLLALSLFTPATVFWRLPCISPLVIERADPIISPGIPSGHVHTIMGGNAFSFNMTYASTQTSTCSSCTVIGDFSNYWTPALYYQHPNGSFTSVPQSGGATIYYLQRPGPQRNHQPHRLPRRLEDGRRRPLQT
jgi:hypothetical protein